MRVDLHLRRSGRGGAGGVEDAGEVVQVLAIGPVTDARSTFAIRTVLSRGPLPLRHWPP